MRLPCVDQPRHEPGASVVATPAPGRDVGHHAVRGRPPEPEQSHPKRFVGGKDPALVFRMRTGSSVSRKRVPAMCPPADIMLGEPPLQSPIHAESDDGHVDPRLDGSTWLRRRNGTNRLTATERSEPVSQVHRRRLAGPPIGPPLAANKPQRPIIPAHPKLVKCALARGRARFCLGGVATTRGHTGECLEHHAVRGVDSQFGVVVGGCHLHHVHARDIVLVAELTHQS